VSGTAEALPCNVIDFIALLGGMAENAALRHQLIVLAAPA
jgi:hypothetical protein